MKSLFVVLMFQSLYLFSSAQTAEDFYNKSQQKLGAGQFLDALELINKAIGLNKNDYWYHLRRAEVKIKLKQYEGASEDIKQAIKIKPDASEPYNRLGAFYESIGEKDSAIANYNLAMKFAKGDTIFNSMLANRAAAWLHFMEWELAIKDLQQVLLFDPKNIDALNNISGAYDETKQSDKAIQCLEKVIQIDSTFVGPYVNLGMIYTKYEDYEKAMHYFDKALELDSVEPLTLNNRGFLWYKMKNYNKAIIDINKSLQLYPSNSFAYKNRALTYIALGKINEGCKDLDAADYYGFSKNYGTEVDVLKEKYCK